MNTRWLARAVLFAAAANAQTPATQSGANLDTVVVAPKPEEPGRIIMTGRVVDDTGAALTIELSSGKQTIPGKRVVEIRTTRSADELAGDGRHGVDPFLWSVY